MKSNIKYHQKLNIFIKKAVVIFVITFSFLSVVACKSSEPESLDDEVMTVFHQVVLILHHHQEIIPGITIV